MASNSYPDLALGHLGNIGRYQIKVYLLSCLPVFIAGAITTALVFTTAVPKYRCFIDGCDIGNSNDSSFVAFKESFVEFTIPKVASNHLAKCSQNARKDRSFDLCLAYLFDNKTQRSCVNYVFDDSFFDSTVVTEFNLVCSWSWFVQLLQSTFFIGILLGAILNGIAADRHGRKAIFVYVCPMLLLALFLGALSPSALIYGVSLFVKGICVAGIYSSAFVIGIEVTGGRYRFWLGNVHSIVFALGAIYSCLMADYFRAWRLVEIALTFPVILMLPYPCIFPESIRWQISNGKIESAVKQIRQAAALNRISIPEEVISSLLSSEQSTDQKLGKIKQIKRKSSIVDLFRHKLMRLWALALICIWFANALVYYGLSFLSSQIGENIYYSMSMLSLVDIPGILLTAVCVEKYSRKAILITVMLLGGISCTVASILPANYVDLKMWLAILGKCFIAGSFSLIYVFTVEIFPTVLRISGLGLCSVFARIGGMTAPYLLQLQIFGSFFPFLAIGLSAIGAGVLSAVLPETKGKRLPDTLEEVAMLQNGMQSTNRQYGQTRNETLNRPADEEQANLLDNEM